LLFVDISGFTKMTERLARQGKVGLEEVNEILDMTFAELLSVAYEDGAGPIKWGGEAVLLLFEGTTTRLGAPRRKHVVKPDTARPSSYGSETPSTDRTYRDLLPFRRAEYG